MEKELAADSNSFPGFDFWLLSIAIRTSIM